MAKGINYEEFWGRSTLLVENCPGTGPISNPTEVYF